MLLWVLSIVFVLPFGMYLVGGVFIASPIMRTLNFVVTQPKTPLLFADKHSLEDSEI